MGGLKLRAADASLTTAFVAWMAMHSSSVWITEPHRAVEIDLEPCFARRRHRGASRPGLMLGHRAQASYFIYAPSSFEFQQDACGLHDTSLRMS